MKKISHGGNIYKKAKEMGIVERAIVKCYLEINYRVTTGRNRAEPRSGSAYQELPFYGNSCYILGYPAYSFDFCNSGRSTACKGAQK